MTIRKNEIYYADLSPAVGSEQGGIRPVLVLQNNIGNRVSPTVIVAALTSKPKKEYLPTHVKIRLKSGKLPKNTIALLEQIRTIDKSRIYNYVGMPDDDTISNIEEASMRSLGIDPGKAYCCASEEK